METKKTSKTGKEKKTEKNVIKITTLRAEKTKKRQSHLNFPSEKDKIAELKNVADEKNLSKDKYLYVYGITNKENVELNIKGLQDKPIQKLNFENMAVLFSFYPNLHPVVEEKEAMLHAEILNELAGKITIIPMAFGTVFKNQEILGTILEKSYHTAKTTLELIKNKIELGIKVVKKEDEEVSEKANKDILEELNKLSVKSVQGDKFSDRLLLNHSFLVERNKFDPFSEKIGELEEKHPNLKFIYTGPWPAYSFVNTNINAG